MAKKSKKLNLALQGGGAHGAYTWGVLDRLLEEEDIEIEAISGTSAGAMNGAVLIDGYARGGRIGAQENLRKFWQAVSASSCVFSPIKQSPLEQIQAGWNLDSSAAYSWFDMVSRMFSPYELNPLNLNPLRDVLEQIVDIKHLRHCNSIDFFATATQVRTGQARVFSREEMSIDVLLASACIPLLFQSIEIDGEAYWDGGYMGNPSIWPLIYNTQCNDFLLVQINPIEREGTPHRAMEIINRLNEITFNASLVSEMRAINFVKKLINEGKLDDEEYKNIRMHMIESPKMGKGLNASSKLNTDFEFFEYLHGLGYGSAQRFLRKHKNDIGKQATLDIEAVFLRKHKKHYKKRA